ncbi:alpha-tocopherol transfer protein-like isoform X1 [Sesbania bispinosa]|nr:alpha-tocopherol transfer protein-like isoform X1 [Sesbania bispinosa]
MRNIEHSNSSISSITRIRKQTTEVIGRHIKEGQSWQRPQPNRQRTSKIVLTQHYDLQPQWSSKQVSRQRSIEPAGLPASKTPKLGRQRSLGHCWKDSNIVTLKDLQERQRMLVRSQQENSWRDQELKVQRVAPSVSGTVPVRLLSEDTKLLGWLNSPSVEGIALTMEQERRSSTRSEGRLRPNQTGIGPGRGKLEALKDCKRVKLAKASTANCGFLRPRRVLLKPEILIPTTRPFWHVIPIQIKQGSGFLGIPVLS